jgi:hypothetical protein
MKKIIIILLIALPMIGWLFLYSISDDIAPNFWKRPVAIKNWLMQNGMVTITLPSDAIIIEGNFENNQAKLISGQVERKSNSITFSKVDYGHFKMNIIFHNQNQTNRIMIPIFHQPDWSKDRYEVSSLNPFEYKVYSDGEFINSVTDDDFAEEEKIKIEPEP